MSHPLTRTEGEQLVEVVPDDLLNTYRDEYNKDSPFGYGALSELVYLRTYSRPIPCADGTRLEIWPETIARVVRGAFSMLQRWNRAHGIATDDDELRADAREMFDRMYHMKFLPPGRGLWAMGSALTEERGMYAALNNCAFVSTKDVATEGARPFTFLMDMSMLGVGVGFDTRGAGTMIVQHATRTYHEHTIPDTREGWVQSVARVIGSFLSPYGQYTPSLPVFDYSLIRKKGSPIRGFGGVSAGPGVLKELHESLVAVFGANAGKPLTITTITDAMNLIGKCVVAGNVRRSAEIALGPPCDEFLDLKDYAANPRRAAFGWASNNSVLAEVGMDYTDIARRVLENGEPGVVWLENAQRYGRMADAPNNKDARVLGVNPCQPAFAPIITRDGLRTMGDVEVGTEIWTERGWAKVSAKWCTGVKPVFRYHTACGEFIGTDNHRIMCRGFKTEVGHADGVDTLPGPRDHTVVINPQDVMDGVVLDCGVFEHDRCIISGKSYPFYMYSEISHLVNERIAISDVKYAVSTTITSAEIPDPHIRVIPERFIYASPSKIAGFLRGLYSQNGSVVDHGKCVRLFAISHELVTQVQMMLSSLGIRSQHSYDIPNMSHYSIGDCKKTWIYSVDITTDRDIFLHKIGFIEAHNNDKIDIATGNCWKKTWHIDYVERLGEHPVYDITVDNAPHTYWSGGLNVSNCGEQSLESMELCNLVETFPDNHFGNIDDYLKTLRVAFLYAKIVTLGDIHWPAARAVMQRNRRIGVSMTGVVQFIEIYGKATLRGFCDRGYDYLVTYDKTLSARMKIPESVKITTIKPSGTVSLLAGATPGMHYPVARHYIRRVRVPSDSPLLAPLRAAGYHVEPCVIDPQRTSVVEFPITAGEGVRAVHEVSMREQLELAAFLQKYWSDNQVSCTVSFPENTNAEEIATLLDEYQHSLKSISFMPIQTLAYKQLPYEPISKSRFWQMIEGKRRPNWNAVDHSVPIDHDDERFCDGDACLMNGGN